jgi:hypothetical protein
MVACDFQGGGNGLAGQSVKPFLGGLMRRAKSLIYLRVDRGLHQGS